MSPFRDRSLDSIQLPYLTPLSGSLVSSVTSQGGQLRSAVHRPPSHLHRGVSSAPVTVRKGWSRASHRTFARSTNLSAPRAALVTVPTSDPFAQTASPGETGAVVSSASRTRRGWPRLRTFATASG